MEREPLSIPKSDKIRDTYRLTIAGGVIGVIDFIVNKGSTQDMTAVGVAAVGVALLSGVKLVSLRKASNKNNG